MINYKQFNSCPTLPDIAWQVLFSKVLGVQSETHLAQACPTQTTLDYKIIQVGPVEHVLF